MTIQLSCQFESAVNDMYRNILNAIMNWSIAINTKKSVLLVEQLQCNMIQQYP